MFQLICKAQNYAWGKMGTESLVGQINAKHFPEDQTVGEKPFAEYWMGDHTNGPSMVKIDSANQLLVKVIGDDEFVKQHDGQVIPMNALFKLNASKFMGQKYVEKFGSDSLTYLFKVLSVRTALSIQAHPNKGLAEKLHVEFPNVYKDPNHKPEIAIALCDDFLACYGFASAEKIKENLA